MLGGVKLADYADNVSFFGTPGSESDYANIFKMAQEMYRQERLIRHIADPETTVDRRYIAALSGKFPSTSTETPIEYKAPAKGATPIATQHRSIYFDTNSANMSVDSRAVVDEISTFMRAYENTVVDIEGNTDSTGSRSLNMQLSKQRADAVKQYLMQKYGYPASRLRTVGNGPDRPIDTNDTAEGREKNRRTDIKVYPNPGA
jgi:outer membrane protein OmpA-like peptidoglycan-associated protein